MLKSLWKKGLDWDENIVEEDKVCAVEVLVNMFQLEDISLNRCVKPSDFMGNLTLVTFCDSLQDAFGACVYLRWKTNNGVYKSSLVASKSRVSPIKVVSIVRLELCGAILGERLAGFIKTETRFEIEQMFFIVDSQIIHSMINKQSYGFNTFTAVHIRNTRIH